MNASEYAFMSKLGLPVEREKRDLPNGHVFEAAVQNGMHEVWFVELTKDGRFVRDMRDDPLADAVRERLKNNAFNYDGIGQNVHKSAAPYLEFLKKIETSEQGGSDFRGPPRPATDSIASSSSRANSISHLRY